MSTDQLIGTLEVLREDLRSLANVQLVGLAESLKADNPPAAASLAATAGDLRAFAGTRLVGLIEAIRRERISDGERPDAAGE